MLYYIFVHAKLTPNARACKQPIVNMETEYHVTVTQTSYYHRLFFLMYEIASCCLVAFDCSPYEHPVMKDL